MVFETRVSGIPCLCEVLHYSRYQPFLVSGLGWGDVIPPEPEEFDVRILDTKERHAPWLESKLSNQDFERLKSEYLTQLEEQGFETY